MNTSRTKGRGRLGTAALIPWASPLLSPIFSRGRKGGGGAGREVRFDSPLWFSESRASRRLLGPGGLPALRLSLACDRWGVRVAGDEVSQGRRESGPSAPPRLTRSWTNPTAHPKNRQLRGALAEVLVTRPFGTGSTTRLKNRVSGKPRSPGNPHFLFHGPPPNILRTPTYKGPVETGTQAGKA